MRAVTLRRGDVVRVRDERWTVDRFASYPECAVVDVRGCDRANRGVHARFLLPFEPLEPVPATNTIAVVTRGQWRHLARQTLAGAVPAWDALRTLAAAHIDILPFQLEPALAVVRGLGARVLVADEVGLGKTVQAGLIAAETLERTPDARVLVVTPAALRDQWLQELRTRFDLAPCVIDSASLAAGPLATGNPWTAHRLVITSVDYIKRPEVIRSLEGIVWDLVIADEAHRLGGRSDRHAAAMLLGERARTLVLLTATPHSGDEEPFARLCTLGDLERRFPMLVFRRTRLDAGLPSARRTVWIRVQPTDAERTMHRALLQYARRVWSESSSAAGARLAMVVLARRACSSAASLSRSVERRLALLADTGPLETQLALPFGTPQSGDEEPLHELAMPGLADRDDERRTLERILMLAQQAQKHESKAAALRRFLRRSREPAIVFTEYRDTLDALVDVLPSFRIARLHGGLTATEREDALHRFAAGEAEILLATDAASEGLNLQHRCRLVINLEVPWTPSRLEQRIGRVDRIGQQRRAHQVQFVAALTSEDTVIAPLVRRRAGHVRDVMTALHGLAAREDDIAQSVLGDERDAAREGSAPVPEGLVIVDLRRDACVEAARARATRALIAPADPQTRWNGRAFAAALRRRTHHVCWAFRLEFTDARGELVFETLVGASGELRAWAAGARDVRHCATCALTALMPAVLPHQRPLLQRVVAALGPPLALAVAREQAIARAVHARHARLAGILIQQGLFDRRAERDTHAQRSELAETLARCQAHLARLSQRQQLIASGLVPVFGLLR